MAYCQEDQLVFDGGIGDGNSYGMRAASVGVQEDLWFALKDRFTVGGWVDSSSGKSSSFLGSTQLGFEVDNGGVLASIFSGPAMISNPDSLLGGYFQFMTDVHFGIQDKQSNYFGIMYRHISSAGIETPNIGRDIIGLELRTPFNW